MTVYTAWRRTDDGVTKMTSVTVSATGEIVWENKRESKQIQALLDQSWFQLDGRTFDLQDPEDYAMLPHLLQGSRLWFTVEG